MLVAPFWIEHHYYWIGQILFRLSNDDELLNTVGSSISEAFSSVFSPTLLFIATYVEIAGISNNEVCGYYYNQAPSTLFPIIVTSRNMNKPVVHESYLG